MSRMRCSLTTVLVILLRFLPGVSTTECFSCQFSDTGSTSGYDCVRGDVTTTVSCNATCGINLQLKGADNALNFLSRGCSSTNQSCCKVSSGITTCDVTYNMSNLTNNRVFDPLSNRNITLPAACPDPANQPGMMKCYSCVYTSGWSDTSCKTSTPPNVFVVCPIATHDCTITRQFSKADEAVRSMNRGCSPKNPSNYGVVEDEYYITWTCGCTGDKCNSAADGEGGSCTPPPPPPPPPDPVQPSSVGQQNYGRTWTMRVALTVSLTYLWRV